MFQEADRYRSIKRWRHAQDVGDVVEPAALVVGRQERGGIDIQGENVVDRIGVFGAIQAMHGRVAGVRLGGVATIQRGFEERSQPVQRGLIGPRHALRGHRADAELADHLFPGFGAFGDVGEIGSL